MNGVDAAAGCESAALHFLRDAKEESAMRIRWAHGSFPAVVVLGLIAGLVRANGQESSVVPSHVCIEFIQTVHDQIARGRSGDAETALSLAFAGTPNDIGRSCDWLILHNMAVLMSRSGRFAEAEIYVERSLKILEKNYPPDDPVMLPPLHLLAAARFQQRKIARAREAFQRSCWCALSGRSSAL